MICVYIRYLLDGKMNILLTNDDGILAPGISALAGAVSDMGKIIVVAPETTQSAAAHSITLNDPLVCTKVELANGVKGFSVNGRPADCVKLALVEILPKESELFDKPDIVISGINAGANVGINVLYSGTVAAAIEAAFFNIPAMAISLAIRDKLNFDCASEIARNVIRKIIDSGLLTPGSVINVNIPECEDGKPKGIKVVPQSTQAGIDRFEKRIDPRGRVYYWLAGDNYPIKDNQETDSIALKDNYVTITPLMFDLTSYPQLEKFKRAFASDEHANE